MVQFQPALLRGFRTFLKFCRWVLLATLAGAVIGAAETGFHHVDEAAQNMFAAHGWLLFLMPLAGVAVVGLYLFCGVPNDRGANFTLIAARGEQEMALRIAPLIGTATVLTHLTGGSAGRSGAVLQLGGSIGGFLGRRLRLEDGGARMMTMCGMAAGFSALFGTPIASAVFALEVASVGVMPYAALVPCVVSALTAKQIAGRLGCEATALPLAEVPAVCWQSLAAVLLLGCMCGLLAWFEAFFIGKVRHFYHQWLPNPYIRAAAGGCLVVVLSLLSGTRDYNGTGMAGVARAAGGEAVPWAFACKLLLTALTLGAGFKGGAIAPTFFIGATFGCTVGALLGLPAGFAAALGTVALFCGMTNAPIASILLAYEMFGGEALPLFGLVCAVSYRLSGCGGLYDAQKMAFSKELPIPYELSEAIHTAAGPEEASPEGGEPALRAEDPAPETQEQGSALQK